MPLAEAYCSRWPVLPQPQCRVSSGFMLMWPISPPAPKAPATSLPLQMTPPPTPVPSVTITQLSTSLAPPCQTSPMAAALASLTKASAAPAKCARSASCRPSASSEILASTPTLPSASTGPGTSRPTATTSAGVAPLPSSSLSRPALTMLNASSFTSSVVLILAMSSRVPSSSKRPALIEVPPISMPSTYAISVRSFATIYRCALYARNSQLCTTRHAAAG